MRVRSLVSWSIPLLTAGALGLAACASPRGGAPLAPAEGIDTLSGRLAGLVERLGPGLVQIRTGPAAGPAARPPAAGFIVDAGGVVLTVAHAVPDTDRVEVVLFDGRRVPGRVIGRDARTDLAAVRVGTGDLTALHLGDSDRSRVGEIVLALGHPYALVGAASLGIVSWKGPPPEGGLPGFDYLHTDAMVNPGNSGGPLVDLAGEVVGVDNLAARNGSMGVAVPSSVIALVLPHLVAEGRVSWGWLGVESGVAPGDDAGRDGGPAGSGLLVRAVAAGSPAEEAGIAAGDRLVAVDGETIDRPGDLHRLILTPPEGRRARFDLLREGRRREVEVDLRPYDEGRELRAGIQFPPAAPREHRVKGTF